ncbi:MAG TPA: aminoglycoside phosphotransferase family protein [Thermoanaerobaculia bacterium]|nr:aminoglycoside phosphotransferase family protein [Thermoanaerobaculia bacterium]
MTVAGDPGAAHRRPDARHLETVLRRFLGPTPGRVEELVAGHINFSWRVRVARGPGYLLQRINHQVFRDPVAVMENVARVTEHVRAELAARGVDDLDRRCLRLVATRDGALYHVDEEGWHYRLYRFIPGTVTHVRAEDPRRVEAAAFAFGAFLEQLAGLDPASLHETISRFHDTGDRYLQLERAVAEDARGRAAGCRAEIDGYLEHRALAERPHGDLPLRAVHDDAKLTNVLFDEATDQALCVIDLDTVMPGLACFDFGEMIRSMSHRFAEDEAEPAHVRCDLELAAAIARGFLAGAGPALSAAEVASLVDGGLRMTAENGVRFLADHLAGDLYFRVRRPGQNLDRARTQLALLRSLRASEDRLRETVDRAWRTVSG